MSRLTTITDNIGIQTSEEPWMRRIINKLFPARHCDLPKAPSHWKDCIHFVSVSTLSIKDRIRIAISGRLSVEAKIVCENVAGGTISKAEIYILPPGESSNPWRSCDFIRPESDQSMKGSGGLHASKADELQAPNAPHYTNCDESHSFWSNPGDPSFSDADALPPPEEPAPKTWDQTIEELEGLREELKEEKLRRTYYQNIVYSCCNILDRYNGVRPGTGIVCGTKDSPSTGLQVALSQVCATLSTSESSATPAADQLKFPATPTGAREGCNCLGCRIMRKIDAEKPKE